MVGLVREPQNPYDSNAVMVTNMYGNQVGHIKRALAAAMADVMDVNLAKVEGWVKLLFQVGGFNINCCVCSTFLKSPFNLILYHLEIIISAA